MDDYDGPHPSPGEDSNSSLQTHPPTPPMSDASNDTTPQQNFHGLQTYRRIQPLALQNGCGPTTKDSMESARQQAIQHWNLPKHPEHGSLARRTRTFYQGPARWDPDGKPSVGDLAQAGFYYDLGFTIIII